VAEIAEKAKSAGIDVIAITDHGTRAGGMEAAWMKNPLILTGQETMTKQGEIIVFNLNHDLKQGRPLLETCKEAKQHNGFIIIPHPFDSLRSGIGSRINDIIPYIDAVEVFCAKTPFNRFNKKAKEFADKARLPQVACSDAHYPKEIGRSHTLIDSPLNTEEIFKAIKTGKTQLVENKSSFSSFAKMKMDKILNKLPRKHK
jgi:predicted metal-dependent phosphoesterase TrpH